MAECVRALAWRRGGTEFESRCGNFSSVHLNGNSVYPVLPVSVPSIWCLCQIQDTLFYVGLCTETLARVNRASIRLKRSHQSALSLEMCNLSWTPPPTVEISSSSQVVLLQTAHSWANAGVLLGARMHRERVAFETIKVSG